MKWREGGSRRGREKEREGEGKKDRKTGEQVYFNTIFYQIGWVESISVISSMYNLIILGNALTELWYNIGRSTFIEDWIKF